MRNWDYRYCWLRDATIVLEALLRTGYSDEAAAWRHWLGRAVAGSAEDVQIMYGVAGERRLTEWTADWLSGYEGSAPVRIGNDAVRQVQFDVYGEIVDTIMLGRQAGLSFDRHSASLIDKLLGLSRGALDRAGRGNLGGARRPAALRPLQGDGLGRVRPPDQDGRDRPELHRRVDPGAVAEGQGRDPRPGVREGL